MIYDYLGQAALVLYPVPGIQNFTNGERYKLIQVSQRVGADPELLAATISIETAGTFDPSKKNPTSSATGLIQWINSTALSIHGMTSAQIGKLSACEQLDLIEVYYKKIAPGGIKIPGDEYVAVAGGKLGRPDNYVIYSAGTPEYEKNKGWDVNKDGVVTSGDIRSLVLGRAAAARRKPPIYVTPEACGGTRGGFGGGGNLLPLVAGAALVGGVWYFTRRG